MEKTYAQRIVELTERVRQLTALRDAGMQCQSALDQTYTDRDTLVKKEQKAHNKCIEDLPK